MATQAHIDNFGVQAGVAFQLQMVVSNGTYAAPVGYTADDTSANVSLTDPADGTFTVANVAAPATEVVPMIPTASVAHEVTDSAGGTIEANTVEQATL